MHSIQVQKEVDHYILKLNRPDKHNSFDPEMIAELTEFFSKAAENKFARAVVMVGAGPSFCSGADIEWMQSMANSTLQENREDGERLFAMFEAAHNCPLPIISYLQGSIFGGGLGLVAISDIAIAEANAKFCFSESRLGLIPAVISPFILQKMHPNKAREYMLTAVPFGAPEALQAGLIEFTERELEAREYMANTLKSITHNGPEALQELKKLWRFLRTANSAEARVECARKISDRRVSAEGQEGLAAFLQKRKPAWIRE